MTSLLYKEICIIGVFENLSSTGILKIKQIFFMTRCVLSNKYCSALFNFLYFVKCHFLSIYLIAYIYSLKKNYRYLIAGKILHIL